MATGAFDDKDTDIQNTEERKKERDVTWIQIQRGDYLRAKFEAERCCWWWLLEESIRAPREAHTRKRDILRGGGMYYYRTV